MKPCKILGTFRPINPARDISTDFGEITDALIDGVAFINTDTKTYDIYLHEGDLIFAAPIFMIEAVIAFIRSVYKLEPGKVLVKDGQPGITFAWEGSV